MARLHQGPTATGNAAFTYRYFGISRQAFYRNDLDFN